MRKFLTGILAAATLIAASSFNVSLAADTTAVAAAGKTVIEAEDIGCSGGVIKENGSYSIKNASGGKVLMFDCTYNSEAYTSTVNAEKSGFYSVSVLANAADGTASDITFTINGRSVKLTTSSAKTAVPQSSGMHGLQMYRFDSVGEVYLEKGANTLSVMIGMRPGYNTLALATLDAFEFELSEAMTVAAGGKSIVEAEKAIADINTRSITDASGGAIAYYEAGYNGDVTKVASFVAEEEGFYKMNIVAAAAPQNPASYVSVAVNDSAAVGLHDNRYYSGSATNISGYYGIKLYNFAPYQLVYLKEGLNTVALTIGKRNDIAEHMLAQFDSFVFEAYDVAAVGEKEAAVEVEDYNWKHTRTVNDKTSVAFYSAGYSSYTLEAAVEAETAGNYNMNIEAAVNDGTSSHLGDLELNINGESIAVNNTDFTVSGLGYNYWDANFPANSYYYNDTVYLNEGINIIKLTITPNSARNDILAAVDKIIFKPVYKITDAEISIDSVMNIGAEKNISIVNQDGNSIANSDVYMITYGTSNDDVIIIDGNGRVTAVGMGTAIVSVAIRQDVNSDEIVKTAKVTVVGDKGVYLDNVQNTNGAVTFDLVSTKEYDEAKIYVAAYDEGRLAAVEVIDAAPGTAGTVSKTALLQGYEAGQTVCIFVWQGMNPVWAKTDIK